MKAYRVFHYNEDGDASLYWRATKDEADALLETLLDDNESMTPSRVDEVNIPLTQKGIIRWLNLNHTGVTL